MSGEEFIQVAGALVANSTAPNPAARHRTAISRCYYGAFHTASEVLAVVGKVIKKNHLGHREAINALLGSSVPDARDAGSIIDDLQTARIQADYRLDDKRPEKADNARLNVEDATQAVNHLRRCLAEPARGALVAEFAAK